MDALFKSLDQSAPLLLLILLIAVVALGISCFRLASQMRHSRSRWKELLNGVDGENLERMVYDNLKNSLALEEEFLALKERVGHLEVKMRSTKRYAGLMRFDAFEEVGGSQSFSMAIYDEEGNGVVVTSQVGRDSCRVYGKPLYNGKSEVNLTVEEQRAIEAAASPRTRPRISP